MTTHHTPQFEGAAWRALADHDRDIVLVTRSDGVIVYANETAGRVYGAPARELRGTGLDTLRVPSTRPLIQAPGVADAEEGVLYETVHIRQDGTHFPVEVSSRRFKEDEAAYELVVVRDLTRDQDARRQSAEMLDELLAANRQLEGLLRIVSSAVGRVDLDQLLHSVLAVLREVMDADSALFFTLEGPSWRLRAQEGYEAERVDGFAMGSDEGFASQVAAAGEALWVGDVVASSAAIPAHTEFGVKAMFGVPMYLEGALFGVLECTWATERLVSDAERVMLQVAADRIMAAVLGAQRYERSVRSQRFGAVLSEISAVINASHQIDTPMVISLQMAAEELECEVAAFGPFRAGVYDIQFAVGVEPRSVIVGGHPELDNDVGIIVIGGPDGASAFGSEVLTQLGVAHCAIVPVAVGGEWYGALAFGKRAESGLFDEAELDFIRRLASVVGIASSNVADYQSEHYIAETLQEALLTLDEEDLALSIGHVYRSATLSTRVGGDFYDAFTMSGGRSAVLIGDVSGKGLDAAVVTSFVKNTVRAFAHGDNSPAAIVAKTNDVLATAARLPDFASVVFMVVEIDTRRVTYCSAGHPPAIVLRANGSVERLECGSPVIGAFIGLDYSEDSFELAEGDIVVLYTDGVTEARAADGGFFGEERLLSVLGDAAGADAPQVPALLNDAVMSFTGGRLSDDIAILAFRIA